ncbi:MAG: NTP transferase domain-containing protein [Propionibacteriales bacterium]|nr:NTP transferase domain-containing protein [Propionibacteriales bacterium]
MTPSRYPAVVTAAGAATRFRPFSHAVPKEMLPLGDTPAVGHVIGECLAGGASEVLVVTRPGDATVPAYVQHLRAQGLPVMTVVEDLAHGYGNATPLLTVAERLADCSVFAVAFGDDILLGELVRGATLAAMHATACGGLDAVVAAQPIPRQETRSFGIIDIAPSGLERVRRIRQRPDPATVREPLAVVSRLILRPSILDRLTPTDRAGGEVDLGVAVGDLAAEAAVGAHRIAGHWVTVGDPDRYRDALATYWQLRQAAPTTTPVRTTS